MCMAHRSSSCTKHACSPLAGKSDCWLRTLWSLQHSPPSPEFSASCILLWHGVLRTSRISQGVPRRHKPLQQPQILDAPLLPRRKVEEVLRQGLPVGAPHLLVTEVLKGAVGAGLERADPRLRVVLEEGGEERRDVRADAPPQHSAQAARGDLRVGEVAVLGVHRQNLALRRRTKNLDDLYHLVDSVLPWEERAPPKHLRENATDRPQVNRGGVVGCAKDELGGAVVARADVRHKRGAALPEVRGGSKVAELK
mmetsp:Transcript_68153/g.210671  ORF Transcript_68153/g.210671 Transcript_68153/m.210671 type:complete len:253 (-) Transcript_68153:823-1581(-)